MKYAITLFITLLMVVAIVLMGAFYIFALNSRNLPIWVLGLIGLLIGGFVLAMLKIGVERLQEQRKEKKDDLSEY